MASSDLDERSDKLDKRLEDNPIDRNIEVLAKDARRSQFHIRVLAISLALDVLLTIGFGVLSVNTLRLAKESENSQAVLINNCKFGNDYRQSEYNLWSHILSIQPVMTNLTPDEQAQRDKTVADFRKYLNSTFAPRDCSNIIKK